MPLQRHSASGTAALLLLQVYRYLLCCTLQWCARASVLEQDGRTDEKTDQREYKEEKDVISLGSFRHVSFISNNY